MNAPNAPAMNQQPDVFYFGCIGQSGHYLFARHRGQRPESVKFESTPWGRKLDGGLLKERKVPDDPNGTKHHFTLDGWTAVAFWDRSVDRRGGSNGAFIVHAEMNSEELLAYARNQWPEVFERPGFPLKHQTDAELWKEFQTSKLLWWVNRSLHVFGWAIIVEENGDGTIGRVYPRRVDYRGFPREDEEAGFIVLTDHLKANAARLSSEVHQP